MEQPEVVEHFFGVYLLYCKNPMYKGRTYIGYTVNPIRRIKQHNAGKQFGGAWRTSNRGPWIMVLIVHGFPNSTSALRFEWAWQHPHLSRRLRHVPKKKSSKQTVFQYRLSILSEMLNVGPWHRLPLTIRWLDYEFFLSNSRDVTPPIHMPISYGKVISKSLKSKGSKKINKDSCEVTDQDIMFCSLCHTCVFPQEKITCIQANCHLMAHLFCLAKVFAESSILPVEGNCPACGTNVLWGDLIRKKIGCYIHLKNNDKSEDSFDDSD
ncbi:structure-specific endonuclease subunit slx1 [Venturia canescens]|uniref:structure-specific endonuclease subunit slx1 n=1 Tax=Venturia canescens TaxID=32260 RepID=UPI001C9CE3A6|nr:structure-specific endonuclease subunit slx1 [Venturia canescens]